MTELFIDKFKMVFDDNNNIRACGREKCKELIELANQIEPEVSHGCMKSGMLNVESLKALKNKLTYKE